MPNVVIPPPYRGPTRGQAEVQVEGKTIRECLDAVSARYPGLRDLIYETDGRLRDFLRLFVNGVPVSTNALDTPVSENDEVSLLAAIAGG